MKFQTITLTLSSLALLAKGIYLYKNIIPKKMVID